MGGCRRDKGSHGSILRHSSFKAYATCYAVKATLYGARCCGSRTTDLQGVRDVGSGSGGVVLSCAQRPDVGVALGKQHSHLERGWEGAGRGTRVRHPAGVPEELC